MPVGREKRLAMSQRRQRVAELYLQHWSQSAIAQELDVAQSTVSSDIKAIDREWRNSAVRDLDQVRAMELAKLDLLERETWLGWQRSQEPIESTRAIQTGTDRRAEKRATQQHGDRRYLELILRIQAARRALLGLDGPAQSNPTSPDGGKPDFSWDSIYPPRSVAQSIPLSIEQRIRAEEEEGRDSCGTNGQNSPP